MANEGLPPLDERIAAAEKVAEIISARERVMVTWQEVMRQAEAGGYCRYAIDLQCSLTRAQNELAEANKRIADKLLMKLVQWEVAHLPEDDAPRVGETPVDTAIRIITSLQSAMAEANRKLSEREPK